MLNLVDAIKSINFTDKETASAPLKELSSPFGENIDPENVLKDYPRPQFYRDNYRSLNGYWNYCITNDRTMPSKDAFNKRILVPFSPETLLSETKDRHVLMPGEFLWYRRSIKNADLVCPLSSRSGRLLLHFGAIDQTSYIYVNDTYITTRVGGYLPITLDITDYITGLDGALAASKNSDESSQVNTITVCAKDSTDSSYHSRGKQTILRGGMYYTPQSGIWKSVWLEWVPESFICKVKAEPDFDLKNVVISFDIASKKKSSIAKKLLSDGPEIRLYDSFLSPDELNKSPGSEVLLDSKVGAILQKGGVGSGEIIYMKQLQKPIAIASKYRFKDSDTAPVNLAADYEFSRYRVKIPFKKPHLWCPNDPFLYSFALEYEGDEIISYFGMRSFEVKKDSRGIKRFFLNNKPYFLKGVLDQGYWPESLMTPPSDEAMLFDITQMKRLGFNMLRKHIKIEDMRWYYHCDRLGMIVWQDMVNGGDKNKPLFVTYMPTLIPHEMIPDGFVSRKILSRENAEGRREWAHEMLCTADFLSNVVSIGTWVLFNEGWGQFDAVKNTAALTSLDKTRPVDQTSGWFDQGGGSYKSIHNYFSELSVRKDLLGRAFVISECGGLALHIDGHSSSDKIYGYKNYDNEDTLNTAFSDMTSQLIALNKKGLCGYVYTQLSDVEEEINGIYTYDRKICKIKETF